MLALDVRVFVFSLVLLGHSWSGVRSAGQGYGIEVKVQIWNCIVFTPYVFYAFRPARQCQPLFP